ncbi:DNA polymerase Y family protein [uncultured Alsobacter sp.]|uniref:Y-family DNA polymerase n=1 Tax=uncultured Alsobacter sp. TaxID=1748258 RepID=UPI00345D282A
MRRHSARRPAGETPPLSAAPPDAPLVVVGREHNALVLTAVDADAAAAGLAPGMPLATARAMVPGLAVAEADPAADAALMETVADWAERYTPFIGLDAPDGLVLDIGGSAHLFGGEAAMLDDLVGRCRRAGLTARGAIAGSRAAAVALARFGRDGQGTIVAPGGEAKAVAPLPVAALGLHPDLAGALVRLGLKRVMDLAVRPRGPLAARFGTDLLTRLDRALGRADEPLSPRRPLPACTAERRFAEPIGHEEDVRRSILALAADLGRILERRGEGARRLELVFFRTDGALRRLTVATGRPLRDPATVLRLYREALDSLADPVDPGFGFDVMRLSALATQRQDAEQTGLDARRQDDALLADLTDRLSARFGHRRVLALAAQDSHVPERASLAVPAQAGRAPGSWADWTVPGEPPVRPVRLVDPPERIEALAEVPDGPPVRFRWRRVVHAVRKAEGPERIAPEWWLAPEGTLTRDYFRVEDEAGRRFWLYREGLWSRETDAPRWFLHGLFA